jgi:ABC-2 type transport system permease protein
MTVARSVAVALAVALRAIRKLLRNPARAVAPMIVPLLFFAGFTGALATLGKTQGFAYYDYTAFVFVFVLDMAAIVVGMFTAFDITFDYQSGMGRRLMVAAPRRIAIALGYVLVAFLRGLVAIALVWVVALAVGMPVRSDPLQIVALIALAMLLNLAAILYGAGIALRFQSTAAGSLILIPVFMLIFLTPMMTPRSTLTGWVHTAANVNPLTPALEAGRGLLANDPVSVGLAFATAAGLVLVMGTWTVLGMRAAEKMG